MSLLKKIYQKLKVRPQIPAPAKNLGKKVKKIFLKNEPTDTSHSAEPMINPGNSQSPAKPRSVPRECAGSSLNEDTSIQKRETLIAPKNVEIKSEDKAISNDIKPSEGSISISLSPSQEVAVVKPLSEKVVPANDQQYINTPSQQAIKIVEANKWTTLDVIATNNDSIISRVQVTDEEFKNYLKQAHIDIEESGLLVVKKPLKNGIDKFNHECASVEALRNAYIERFTKHGQTHCDYNLGIVIENNYSKEICFVYEENGPAEQFLLKQRQNYSAASNPVASQIIVMFKNLMNGMKQMHEAGYLHLNITARNVLINSDYRARLANNENCMPIDKKDIDQKIKSRSDLGLIKWMDKIRIKNLTVDRASDLYSLKVCMIEMLANSVGLQHFELFDKFSPIQVAINVMEKGNNEGLGLIKRKLKSHLLRHSEDETCHDIFQILKHFDEFLSWDDNLTLKTSDHLAQADLIFKQAYQTFMREEDDIDFDNINNDDDNDDDDDDDDMDD